jgi:hypothetical protein
VLRVEKSCWFLSLRLWNFLPKELMGAYYWNSFWSMFTCIRIKEEINLDFIEIRISLVFIWVHDLLWIVVNFPSFYILLKHNGGGEGEARSQVLPLLSNRKWKKNISLSFLKCRSWKHTLRTTWQWMPFGALTMFITSNIVY